MNTINENPTILDQKLFSQNFVAQQKPVIVFVMLYYG